MPSSQAKVPVSKHPEPLPAITVPIDTGEF